MNREIRKLSKKIDELQKQINYQNECIMDQSMIIHKLKEKIVGYSPYLDERFTGPIKPYNPPVENPFTWPTEPHIPPHYTTNVICLHCGRDSGIPSMLHMVIPPEGLKCGQCGRTAVYSNSPTCQEPYTTTAIPCTTTLKPYENVCTNTTNFDPNIKGYNKRETTPITHRSYDGTKTTLPATTPEKWTGTASQLNDFLWENRHNL